MSHQVTGDRPLLAILSALVVAVVLSFADALVRLVSVDMVVWQIFVLRSCIALPFLIALCRFRKQPVRLTPLSWRWTVLRSALMVLMWLIYYGALLTLPISTAASVYFTMPIMVTLLAALLMGEQVGRNGWLGVMLGFIGVLVIIRPDQAGVSPFLLLPLSAAFLFAVSMIITRARCRDEHPYVIAWMLNIAFLAAGLLATLVVYLGGIGRHGVVADFFAGQWQPMDVQDWLVILVLAVAIIVANSLTAVAYQLGRSSVIATVSFAYVPLATLWGVILFQEVPDLIAIFGIAIVIAAGLLAIWRRPRA